MAPYILGGNDPAIFEHKNNIWREFIKDVCRVGCFPTVEDLPFSPLLPVLSLIRESGPGLEVIYRAVGAVIVENSGLVVFVL